MLVPSKDSALQIERVIKHFGEYLYVNTHACVGDKVVKEETKVFRRWVHLVVGKPGRVFDMMNRNNLDPKYLKILVLDKAD